MKRIILILHFISGFVLEINDPTTINKIKSSISHNYDICIPSWSSRGLGEIRCLVNGHDYHINMNAVEIIEEKEINDYWVR